MDGKTLNSSSDKENLIELRELFREGKLEVFVTRNEFLGPLKIFKIVIEQGRVESPYHSYSKDYIDWKETAKMVIEPN